LKPVANLLLVSSIPAANLHTGGQFAPGVNDTDGKFADRAMTPAEKAVGIVDTGRK
jgi:hypothetical protein